MLNKDVAVNDLGLVSFNSSNKVLDLWGLGSIEAFNIIKNSPEGYNMLKIITASTNRKYELNRIYQLNKLLLRKHIDYIMIYNQYVF